MRRTASFAGLTSRTKKRMPGERAPDPRPLALAKQVLGFLHDHFHKIQKKAPANEESHEWDSPENKIAFKKMLTELCEHAKDTLAMDPTLLRLSSPAYVLGDLHGSYRDLAFFARALFHLGVDFTADKYLFLGDFVDRGPHQVEVIAHLLALKVAHPKQIFLLRGNHEFTDMNDNPEQEYYGFHNACYDFADQNEAEGKALCRSFNAAFEYMPLAAVIDRRIFCCHGGIPRMVQNQDNVLEFIENIQRPLTAEDYETKDHALEDLMWADPDAKDSDRTKTLFKKNTERGASVLFGKKAMERFFEVTGCTMVIRAHQAQDLGFQLSLDSQCLTVFSSSNYNDDNSAALAFVNEKRVKVAVTNHSSKLRRQEKEFVVDDSSS